MKRRAFLQSLAALPYVGSSVAWLAPKPALGVPEHDISDVILDAIVQMHEAPFWIKEDLDKYWQVDDNVGKPKITKRLHRAYLYLKKRHIEEGKLLGDLPVCGCEMMDIIYARKKEEQEYLFNMMI